MISAKKDINRIAGTPKEGWMGKGGVWATLFQNLA